MVKIRCYARINLGLIDLTVCPIRADGSHGFYTNLPIGEVVIENDGKSNTDTIRCLGYNEGIERIVACCRNLIPSQRDSFRLTVTAQRKSHIGLGTGTQIRMAIVEAFNQLYSLSLTLDEKAFIAQSGGTSGVGVYCFNHGGYIIDAGRLYPNEKSTYGPSESFSYRTLPPLTLRLHMPKWYIVIATPKHYKPVFGEYEQELFRRYAPVPEDEVNLMCRSILQEVIPSIRCNDLKQFNTAVSRIMDLGFRKREISTYDNYDIQYGFSLFKNNGLQAVGMTSFGPSIFGLTDDICVGRKAVLALRNELFFDDVYITTPRNEGRTVINQRLNG